MIAARPTFVIVGVLLVVLVWHPTAGGICPSGSAWNLEDAFGLRGSKAYVQRRIWHRVPCLLFSPDEELQAVTWYKGSTVDDPTKVQLISRQVDGGINKDTPANDRYSMSSNHSLVIKGVQDEDEGSYLCGVLSLHEYRVGKIGLLVIGDTFTSNKSEASSKASLQRGRRQTLPCECASQTPDVVYWSTGEGVTADTHIIGARFSDGATLQIQYGADYIIGSDASLTVNSLNDVQDTQRFWCHVFQSDGTLRNCDTDVLISVDEFKPASDALKASERSFYLPKNTQQTLPCLNWTPGDTACEVEWSKLDNQDRQVLNYNLSTGVVDSSPEFDLTSNFGLVIRSVSDDHAGVYRCDVGKEIQIDVEVRVIGDRFPLDGGSAIGFNVTFKLECKNFLQCPALSNITLTTKATVFWSYGALDAQTTNVIGELILVPDGSQMFIEMGDNDCFSLSTEGDLLLKNCYRDGNVRYWCHVFPANDDLIRSYVDMLIEDSNGDPEPLNIYSIFQACLTFIVVVLYCWAVFPILRRRFAYNRERRRGSYSPIESIEFIRRSDQGQLTSHIEDRERGDCNPVDRPEPIAQVDLMTLAKKVKLFVIGQFREIPITPWVDGKYACFAFIYTVYTPLEMFVNVFNGGSTVKYQLDSESGIFNDGIPELASSHAIIQGRRGCGKTTFLYRLIFDWALGREHALWGRDQIVVLVPAWLLIKAQTIGEVIVKCMLPEDANISAESIHARDKSNLTILVDDCNDKDDIDAVMKVMTNNEFLGCQLVMTTRNAKLAKAASLKHNMRHVTITGFTRRNAIEYINVVLDAAEERKQATLEHKEGKIKVEAKSGSTADIETEVSPTVSAPPEANESTVTGRYPEVLKTTTRKKKRNLHRYLEEDILPPEMSCLPAVLVALCQMSIWTKGDAFRPDVTMTNLFFRLVKCMFDRMKGLKVGVTEGHQLSLLTKDQLNVLTELGRLAYSRLADGFANSTEFATEDFLNPSKQGERVLKVAIELGLLLQVKSNVESTEQSTADVSEAVIRTRCLYYMRKQQSGTDPDPISQGTELTPLTSPKDERICFILEILEQLCVGVFMSQAIGQVKQWVNDITKIGHRQILSRFSNVLLFAIQDNEFDREALVDSWAKIVNRGYGQVRPFHAVLQLQKFVELCLQLNFEGQCGGALNKKLNSVFPDGRVRLIGISSYKLLLLSYLLEHAQTADKRKLNVKSVELLRIGRYDWSELQEYIEHFISGKKGPERKTMLKTKTKDSQPSSSGICQAIFSASQDDTAELSTDSEDFHSAQKQVTEKSSKSGCLQGGESNIDDLWHSSNSDSKRGATPRDDHSNEDESVHFLLDENTTSYDVIDSNEAVLKMLREKIQSNFQDMPQFPPDESDISVLHTVQSFCLQELLESQAGECYSSVAARDFARYLPCLEMLESLVLVGTILSSDAICDLAKSAHNLPNLKKLDVRLNTLFDDRAFVAITNFPLRECKKLTDLRLSLYEVTDEGFYLVQKEKKKRGEGSWGRLKTLYLLHGSPAEMFVEFLSNSLKYFHFVECLHLSATHKEERIQNTTLEEFEQKVTNPKIMPNLETLDIGNMGTLKARLAPLKLPKKKKVPQCLKKTATSA